MDAASSTVGRAVRQWDDAPLQTKVMMLVLVAAVGGALVGMIESALNYRVWPLFLGMFLLCSALLALGKRWVTGPVEQLLESIRRACLAEQPTNPKSLPTDRQDEVGELARLIQQMTRQCVVDHHQAKTLRRTMHSLVKEETQRATQQLQQIAMRDPMTDLGNRRFLDENLDKLVRSCQESKTDLVCVMVDLDNFKKVNDKFGHAVGDELLKFVARLMRETLRQGDLAVRLGGDEFVAFMPGARPEMATMLFERILALFIQYVDGKFPSDIKPRLSAGVASLQMDSAHGGKHLMEVADGRLYKAKGAGKGRVVSAG